MNKPYYCRLSGGNVHRVDMALSAGEAIHQAIWLHRGNTVTECWRGQSFKILVTRTGELAMRFLSMMR